MGKRYKAELKANLKAADPRGWVQHSEYHWSRMINGSRLHFWPSQKKWRFCGDTQTGDVKAFIEGLTNPQVDKSERRSRPRGNPNWTSGHTEGMGRGRYGERRTMVVRIPCEALPEVSEICKKYEVVGKHAEARNPVHQQKKT